MNSTTAQQGCGVEAIEVAVLASRYCDLIDASSRGDAGWLSGVATLLPRLHAKVASLAVRRPNVDRTAPVDLDERFELFSRLLGILDDRDGYWFEFDGDPSHPDGIMTGSLADDLTDIYCELKSGLRIYVRNPEGALEVWTSGFDRHWGQHLVDAQRHLVRLAAENRLER